MKYALRLHFYSTFENYLWHINTLMLCNGIEWNVVIVGIYFTCPEAVFSFYLHTFLTHLNKWNTRWDCIFYSTFENYLWHINTLILCNGIEWNVVIVGIYFYVFRSCFSFYLHTFLTHLNKWNTRLDCIFIRLLKTTCGI